MGSLIDRIRANEWLTAVSDSEPLGDAPTMLAMGERKMLHWLAMEAGDGAVIDAGSFLGGSALALASGLSRSQRNLRVHCYDCFIVPRDAYQQSMLGGLPAGSSFLALFKSHTAPFADRLQVHAGDFLYADPPTRPISILFIDISKSLELETHVRRRFFPHLIPNQSLVVHQDYNYHSNPWIVISMEHLSQYMHDLTDQDTSRVFVVREPIPEELLNCDLTRDLSTADRLRLMDNSIEREMKRIPLASSSHKQEIAYLHVMMRQCAKSFLMIVEIGAKQAVEYLETATNHIPDYQWKIANIDALKSIAHSIGGAAGFRRYQRDFFRSRWQLNIWWRSFVNGIVNYDRTI